METIGSEALIKAKLVVVSGITFRCSFTYKQNGVAVDLSSWNAYMDFYQNDAKVHNLDGCIALGDKGMVQVHMPPSVTEQIKVGVYTYDIVLEDPNMDTVRLAMGTAKVTKRYSYDG